MGGSEVAVEMNWAVIIAGFLSGIIGAMGLGGGAVLIIYLAVFTSTEQLTAQGINLLFFLPIGITAVIIYTRKRLIEWKTVIPICTGGILGAVLGILLSGALGGEITAKVFGGLLLILGTKEIFSKKNKDS